MIRDRTETEGGGGGPYPSSLDLYGSASATPFTFNALDPRVWCYRATRVHKLPGTRRIECIESPCYPCACACICILKGSV